MKKALAILLSCAMLLTGCSLKYTVDPSSPEASVSTVGENVTSEIEDTESQTADDPFFDVDTRSEEYETGLGFTSLDDENLKRYIKDRVYSDLELAFSSDDYIVENVETQYITKEYVEELNYNSMENVFFNYTLSELDKQFEGQKYIFSLGDNGQTTVEAFEEYDDTYAQALKKIAIGTGVILVCVTVSVVSGGTISVVFAASAKTATEMALSSGLISGVSSGIITGIETHDFDEALKAAADQGSKDFMWGAISGAVIGGASELIRPTNTTNRIKLDEYTKDNSWDELTELEVTDWDIDTPPHWRQSEEFVSDWYKSEKTQVSFLDGKEVSKKTKNSTRPDAVRKLADSFEAIEVKNYDLVNNYSSLKKTLQRQITDRVNNLPNEYTQRIVLDARNRNYSKEFLEEVAKKLQSDLDTIYDNIPIDIITNSGTKILRFKIAA